jgi:UDP-N-acetylmuramate dehydrogenase
MKQYTQARKEKQPLELPSAGSAFKRPEGFFADKLIEDCGLKGRRVGGAEVSTKHAGFIVNVGGAKARDVLDLVDIIKTEVLQKFGVELEPEIKFIG